MERIKQVHTASGVNVASGIWLFFSPIILGFSSVYPALVNNMILGAIISFLAIVRVSVPEKTVWASVVNLLFGIWLTASPFILPSLNQAAAWNNVIVGLLIAAMAVWSASATSQNQRHA